MNEAVKHPDHYNRGGIEAIDVIQAWKLNFSLGNALKYICRAGYKGDAVEDLQKAKQYIDFEINDRIGKDESEKQTDELTYLLSVVESMVSTPAQFEQAAEECTELAHALLKYARVIREENPTPVTMVDALVKVREEYTDLMLCAKLIGLKEQGELMQRKAERWVDRLERDDID